MKTTIAKILVAAAAAVALAGCVSESKFNEHVASADAAIKAAAQEAAAAKASADAANAAASSASSAASAAQSAANQALQAAKSAQACCDANSEKIDRAFQKSMGK
jgi:murein lipoprotein